jgi:CubicO group peptidase (beta-lactamase class C family)
MPGISYGVLHHGEIIHLANFGFRDAEAKLVPASDTIYGIGSLSKSFTAATVGVLVEDGRLSWNALVRDVLPAFNSTVPHMNEQLTVLDLLIHMSGLAGSNDIWTWSNSVPLLDKSQTIPTFNYLGAANPFRGQFQYNNWGYVVAGEIIEALFAQSWGTFLEEKLIKPLDLDRTFTTRSAFKNDNDVAKPYGALDDASVYPLSEIQMEDGTIMASAGAVRSTVNDMLKWPAALLKAYKNQLASGEGSTTGSPLKQIPF